VNFPEKEWKQIILYTLFTLQYTCFITPPQMDSNKFQAKIPKEGVQAH
jgi:hypothetical protein